MTVEITGIRVQAFQNTHGAITHYRWRNSTNRGSGIADKANMVAWVESGGQAFVASAAGRMPVRVVQANPSYLQTVADGNWSNNLLSLPHC